VWSQLILIFFKVTLNTAVTRKTFSLEALKFVAGDDQYEREINFFKFLQKENSALAVEKL